MGISENLENCFEHDHLKPIRTLSSEPGNIFTCLSSVSPDIRYYDPHEDKAAA